MIRRPKRDMGRPQAPVPHAPDLALWTLEPRKVPASVVAERIMVAILQTAVPREVAHLISPDHPLLRMLTEGAP